MATRPAPVLTAIHAALLVAFMWGAYFLNYCDRQAISAMFPVLKADLGLSDTQLGLTGSIFLWVYGICCPLAGQVADRFSKRLLVVFSLAVWSLVTVLTGLANSVWMLLSLRAAMGISEALYMPAAISLTANAHPPEKRSRAVATLTTAQVAGTVGGAWFGGWMAGEGQWRQAFFCLGALGLAYAVPYLLFLRTVPESPAEPLDESSPEEAHRASGRLAVAELARVPTFGVLCVVFPAFVFGLWMLYSWLPTFLYEKFDLDLKQAAYTATVYLQTATLFGLLLGGILADKMFLWTKASRLWLMTASLVLCAPCLHLIGNSNELGTMRMAAAAFGLFSVFLMGNIFPAAFEVVPAHTRASAVGLLNFFGAITSGFAPLVVGLWKESVGIERLLSYTSILYLAAGALLIVGIQVLFPRDYRRSHGPET
ncbi:MAG: MFS transporter [Aureliella sp.]